jgi:hypothetical protein
MLGLGKDFWQEVERNKADGPKRHRDKYFL